MAMANAVALYLQPSPPRQWCTWKLSEEVLENIFNLIHIPGREPHEALVGRMQPLVDQLRVVVAERLTQSHFVS